MFASKVARPQTRAGTDSDDKRVLQRPAYVARPFAGAVEREIMPEPEAGSGARSGISRNFSRIPVFAHGNGDRPQPSPVAAIPNLLQAKLIVGAANSTLEREADRAADQVMRMPAPRLSLGAGVPTVSRKCAACEEAAEKPRVLQTKQAGVTVAAGGRAPSLVHDVLRGPGRPLDAQARFYMEGRFGQDFRHVRVHADATAAQSAAAVNALAYTVGSHVVFGAGRYAPDSLSGRHLIAHELAHVVQQNSGASEPVLQRFQASETTYVAPTWPDMVAQIKKLIDGASTNGAFDWDFFVESAGGSSAKRALSVEVLKALGSNDPRKSILPIRYLFTCRCGLIDMLHFIEMLYISNFSAGVSSSEFRGNRAATHQGRQHELKAESASQFGAEDTPTNALGAATNLDLPGLPSPDAVFNAIKDTLRRCDPIDWTSLSAASKDQIVHFYGDQVPNPTPTPNNMTLPKHQNQTAIPDILPIGECGGRERSLPFKLDDSDTDRKTLTGKAFDKGSAGLTSDSDIRKFVGSQRPELLSLLPPAEKLRLVIRLAKGWVSDDDLDAFEAIYRSATTAEKQQIQAAVKPDDLSGGQRSQLRAIYTM